MPGNEEEKVVVRIGDKDIELKPLVGMRAIIVVPKLTEVLARIVYAAGQANFDLRGIFQDSGFNFDKLKFENLLAVPYIAEQLEASWPKLTNEIMPALLGVSTEFLLNNGSPSQHFHAIWVAIKYHAPSVFGESTWAALKKLLAAEEAETQEVQTSSDSNETSP